MEDKLGQISVFTEFPSRSYPVFLSFLSYICFLPAISQSACFPPSMDKEAGQELAGVVTWMQAMMPTLSHSTLFKVISQAVHCPGRFYFTNALDTILRTENNSAIGWTHEWYHLSRAVHRADGQMTSPGEEKGPIIYRGEWRL